MRWGSAVSIMPDTDVAVAEVGSSIEGQLKGQDVDLLFVFASSAHSKAWDRIAVELTDRFPLATVLGCSAGGVIGGGREIEAAPGLSVVAASLPDVSLHTFALDDPELPDPDKAAAFWSERLGLDPAQDPCFVLLPDPFTCDGGRLIAGLDLAFPGQVKIGGLASGGRSPGTHRLLLDGAVRRSGVVGVAMVGDVQVDTVVAQGCRPMGPPFVVTASKDNVIISLDGLPALSQLQQVFSTLGEDEQERFQAGPMVGLAVHEDSSEYLISNLVGMDRAAGVLAVGATVHVGQRVRFQVLDAAVASTELDARLHACQSTPEGALLFSCLGRGARFFGLSDHDTDLFHSHLGGAAMGGFFCNGEIGPVHGRTWMHGYTSAFGLFRPRGWD